MIGANVRWTNATTVGKTVSWEDDDGEHSRSVLDPDVEAWLAEGNVPADPPPPPAAFLLQQKMDVGLTIEMVGASDLDGAYPVNPQFRARLAELKTYYDDNDEFPSGGPTVDIVDVAGQAREVNIEQLKAIAREIGRYIYSLETTARSLAAGDEAEWPSGNATVD